MICSAYALGGLGSGICTDKFAGPWYKGTSVIASSGNTVWTDNDTFFYMVSVLIVKDAGIILIHTLLFIFPVRCYPDCFTYLLFIIHAADLGNEKG